MNAKCFYFGFGGTTKIDEDIFLLGFWVFIGTYVNCGPSEDTFHDFTAFAMDIASHRRGNLKVRATVSDDIDVAIVGVIIHEPRNLIGVSL